MFFLHIMFYTICYISKMIRWMKTNFLKYVTFDEIIFENVFVIILNSLLYAIFVFVFHDLNDFLTIMKFYIDFHFFNIIWQDISKQTRKTKKFNTKFEFLIVEFNNEIMQIRFFSVKLTRTMKIVNVILIANFLTNFQIDFFVNFLFFCAKNVIFERFFFNFLYVIRDHIRNINKTYKFNEIMRVDLRW